MLDSSARRILERLADDDLVLDVGGWAHPFERADWVLDAQPYQTRGLYGYDRARAAPAERFSHETWLQRDVCAREPWPFEDDRFAFAVCSHTLEDLRDPVWVCGELARVARAGYVEVPARAEEQTVCLEHPGARWAGWSHHRWLCDVHDGGISFVHKPHFLHVGPEYHLPPEVHARLTPEQRVQQLWWTGRFDARETLFADPADLREYLMEPVLAHAPPATRGGRTRRALRRVARR
jgi:hypothetical protein